MTVVSQIVGCGSCETVLNESPSALSQERRPCPSCCSLTRRIDVQIEETLFIGESMRGKVRHEGGGRPHIEVKTETEVYRETGEVRHVERSLDREKDLYQETITNPKTGQVVTKVKEPLTDHQGHGSARRRKEPAKGE